LLLNFEREFEMRYFVLLLVFGLLLVGCCSDKQAAIANVDEPLVEQGGADVGVFDSWDKAVEFLQWRHVIPVTETAKEQTKKDSVIRDVNVEGITFRIINLDWKGKSRFGIRGKNGPVYIFQLEKEKYKLVGGFLAESADVFVDNGVITAVDRHHISVAEHPSGRYPLINGVFNQVSLGGRGDVFK
jgi:hypothetical protein